MSVGTCTRLCKRPGRALTRLAIGGLRANGSASRDNASDTWSSRVNVTIEAGDEAMQMSLADSQALGFGLDLLEGAAFCYQPEPWPGREVERQQVALPPAEELRLLACAARAAAVRSPEAEADLALLADLCARTDGQPEASQWPEAGRHESGLDALRRAGLVKVQGYGLHSRAFPTDAGRVLARMLGGAK